MQISKGNSEKPPKIVKYDSSITCVNLFFIDLIKKREIKIFESVKAMQVTSKKSKTST